MYENNDLRSLLAFFLLFTLAFATVAEEDFLLPDQAFQVSASAKNSDAIEIRWDIADGYYLYRNKFSFRNDSPEVALGEPEYSPAEVKKDPFFGEVEVYHNQAVVRLPIEHKGDTPILTIKTRSQGCAEQGICYPPHEQIVRVELPADAPSDPPPPATIKNGGGLEALTRLGKNLGLVEGELLTAEEAYRFNAEAIDANHLQLTWQIADGTYLYKDKIQVQLEDAKGVTLGAYQLPPAKLKKDALLPDGTLGDIEVYYRGIDLQIPLQRTTTEATELKLVAKYQGCADQGVCYPPQTQRVALTVPAGGAPQPGPTADVVSVPAPATSLPPAIDEPVAEHDRLSEILLGGNMWLIIAAFFIAGLGLAFTPCVFPMIPILSGIIAGQGNSITPGKGFVLATVYVLSMAVTYTVAGVLAGLFGQNLQVAFQNPWVLSIFAAVFVLLALSMFGFFELQLPSRLQSRLTEISNRQQGGNLIGVGIMGFLSALIVGPCLAPPLAAALIVIGQTGDAMIGGTALFFLALGMGVPLIAIGTSAGRLLPRAGAWMDTVKVVFGVIMLGVAIYLLERIIPP
ncbi:MAG TPA: protein-disulfide reductase DsbD, partial [Chromatiales bacterium]|nr:protein-disulfide reductase DsbD [Chromatiales bacterium]